jgi:anaerobic selenocysteine-containing dehydrogenase
MSTHHRTCPLCEATCGVTLTLDGDRVVSVRGDADDVFSRGFICPKGVALGDLHHDPDRLRRPLVRDQESGALREATWEQAFDVIRERLGRVIADHGPNSVAVYLGNPNSHNVASTFYVSALIRALGTGYRFTASTVDQMPKQVSAGLMFGTELSVPIPDIDRTDMFLVLGANPMVSNGSLLTAPDFPGRLRALRKRGGRLVVVDPVRTRTAAVADEHLAIRPGSDALWLAAVARSVLENGAHLGAAEPYVDQNELTTLRSVLTPFTPEAVAQVTGIDAAVTRRIAGELAAAPSAAVYGRMGTTTTGLAVGADGMVALGTVASWLVDVVNILIGSLDRPGGVMWPLPPAGGPTTQGTPGKGRGIRIPGSRRTRVRGLPSVIGEFPVVALAEEIDTPDPQTGEHVRALITIAGNPVVSTPDGGRLERAIGELDCFISLDAYLTETSRHADVILPAPSPLVRKHFDVVFANLAIRNTARWSPPSLPAQPDERDEADTLLQLAAIAAAANSGGPEPTVAQMDDLVAFEVARRACTDAASRAHGRQPADLLAAVAPATGVERLLDLRLRSGPYGDGFGTHPGGLTLSAVAAAPHGIDLGPMQPRLPEVLRTPSGAIELAPEQLVAACAAAADVLDTYEDSPQIVLVGRRQLRSNNSWMHNLAALNGGSNRCTLLIHPDDAERIGVTDGGMAVVATPTGTLRTPVAVTDQIRPGVACLPHGWGHSDAGTWGEHARENAGVNVNLLVGSGPVDELSGTAVLGGAGVEIRPG